MIIIEDGEIVYMDEHYKETCPCCGAMGYGNATCATCVREWVRFGHDPAAVARLLEVLGDRPPEPPLGTGIHWETVV